MNKLNININNPADYVRVVSRMFPKGLTKAEMKIVILTLEILKLDNNAQVIRQEHKEKVRIGLELSSQTMHNYWGDLKRKGVFSGNYNNYTLHNIFKNPTQLTITYNVKS